MEPALGDSSGWDSRPKHWCYLSFHQQESLQHVSPTGDAPTANPRAHSFPPSLGLPRGQDSGFLPGPCIGRSTLSLGCPLEAIKDTLPLPDKIPWNPPTGSWAFVLLIPPTYLLPWPLAPPETESLLVSLLPVHTSPQACPWKALVAPPPTSPHDMHIPQDFVPLGFSSVTISGNVPWPPSERLPWSPWALPICLFHCPYPWLNYFLLCCLPTSWPLSWKHKNLACLPQSSAPKRDRPKCLTRMLSKCLLNEWINLTLYVDYTAIKIKLKKERKKKFAHLCPSRLTLITYALNNSNWSKLSFQLKYPIFCLLFVMILVSYAPNQRPNLTPG